MLTTVGGGICLKTLVALVVMLSILGQCEMSIYPGELKIAKHTKKNVIYEYNIWFYEINNNNDNYCDIYTHT